MLFSRSDSVYSMSSVAMLLIYTYKKYTPLSVTSTYTVDDNGIRQHQIHIPEYLYNKGKGKGKPKDKRRKTCLQRIG